jgi:hypothetical protein
MDYVWVCSKVRLEEHKGKNSQKSVRFNGAAIRLKEPGSVTIRDKAFGPAFGLGLDVQAPGLTSRLRSQVRGGWGRVADWDTAFGLSFGLGFAPRGRSPMQSRRAGGATGRVWHSGDGELGSEHTVAAESEANGQFGPDAGAGP